MKDSSSCRERDYSRGPGPSPLFGDGSDGDAVLTYADEGTLVRDMHYRDLTMPADFDHGGWRIFACGKLTLLLTRLERCDHLGMETMVRQHRREAARRSARRRRE